MTAPTYLDDDDDDLAPHSRVAPVGLLNRWRMTEPVRLWLGPVALIVLVTLWLNGAHPVVLALVLGGAVATIVGLRGAVYSERTWGRDVFAAHRAGIAEERERGLTITTRAVARRLTERIPL